MKLWCVDQKSGSPALGGADDGDMVNDDDEIIIRGMLINSTIKKLILEVSANKKRMNEQKKKDKRTNEQTNKFENKRNKAEENKKELLKQNANTHPALYGYL